MHGDSHNGAKPRLRDTSHNHEKSLERIDEEEVDNLNQQIWDTEISITQNFPQGGHASLQLPNPNYSRLLLNGGSLINSMSGKDLQSVMEPTSDYIGFPSKHHGTEGKPHRTQSGTFQFPTSSIPMSKVASRE